ncbi:MAG: cytochrome c oxidase accessory protein CcoG [Gammaproteobacteria bacterium]|nr:cytochrome c oxidase accessory protein CcoG [Gammaproteobacteria bacterium]
MTITENIAAQRSAAIYSEKIFPREVRGRFQSLRSICVYLLLGAYYLLPWVQWGERQAVLFDLPARKFHIFMLTFWPQDFYLLSLLLIMAGIALFFFTAIAGRVWCGYACPQTVWTEIFIWMERWVEGSRAQQIKLASSPWTFNKLRKRIIKQVLWVSFALLTGLTFVGYFMPIRQLLLDAATFELAGWSLFWVLFYSFATYGNAGFLREQVCKYMCPYARFQSAMFDRDTLIVAYDQNRGEPRSRGKKRKQTAAAPKGDCVDCGLCVQVCPTGIDIREGLQYECIACAACIDVCNNVMDSVAQPRDLIRYSTEAVDSGQQSRLPQLLLRPRVLTYAVILMALIAAFGSALLLRATMQVDVLRDRNTFYRMTSQGIVENTFQIRIMNKSQIEQRYHIAIHELTGASVSWSSPHKNIASAAVAPGEIGDLIATVSIPADRLNSRAQKISFMISETLGPRPTSIAEESRFWGPTPQADGGTR